jgi:fructose-1,6-bisphosphatase/inositol monophosphatase family enzyme
MPDLATLLAPILALHDGIRASVVDACTRQSAHSLAQVAADGPGDTIFAIDRVSEDVLIQGLTAIAQQAPLCVVAEGVSGGVLVLPPGAREDDCEWRVLVDPIDGTRGLMYQKRSAWILTGVAPNRGAQTRLRDIALAVQTEIPLVKQHLSDQLWAMPGQGVRAQRFNRLSGASEPLTLQPSRADSLLHGYASISRFFPGGRDILAAIDEELMRELLGPPEPGKAACFEDQYTSTGGQLHELACGHDRFIADLRPLVQPRGPTRGLCCHPYDICTALIAEELGVVITDAYGQPFDAPFNVDADVAWIGYANPQLRTRIEPVLQRIMQRRGL